MAYYEDLTPYEYDTNNEDGKAVNVGWLAPSTHTPTTGEAPQSFLERLKVLPIGHPYRGWHVCEWCKRESGNGDVRVPGDGVVYVAPALIAHYVEVHGYLPPQAFIDAVLAVGARESP